jgi:sugar O-acyltransferase (sialic acid O-acetyltransferase NeuD family)
MSDKPEIILAGAGGHAMSCIDVIESQNKYQIIGLTGKQEEIGNNILGYKVISDDEGLGDLAMLHRNALVTIGQIKSAVLRKNIYSLLSVAGFHFPVIRSPFAYISPHANVGPGSIIMPGAVINSGVEIGSNCIINSGAVIEHGVTIGDFCHVSTNSVINGDVSIGSESFIGSGAMIKENLVIGSNCIVGMGMVIKTNLFESAVKI